MDKMRIYFFRKTGTEISAAVLTIPPKFGSNWPSGFRGVD
jgi:hypothetical protein